MKIGSRSSNFVFSVLPPPRGLGIPNDVDAIVSEGDGVYRQGKPRRRDAVTLVHPIIGKPPNEDGVRCVGLLVHLDLEAVAATGSDRRGQGLVHLWGKSVG